MQSVIGRSVLTDGERIIGMVSDLASLRGHEIIELKGE